LFLIKMTSSPVCSQTCSSWCTMHIGLASEHHRVLDRHDQRPIPARDPNRESERCRYIEKYIISHCRSQLLVFGNIIICLDRTYPAKQSHARRQNAHDRGLVQALRLSSPSSSNVSGSGRPVHGSQPYSS
jgi:hypothetical protein